MSCDDLSAGEVARRFGLSMRQLEHWRKIGLVEPSHTTAGGHSRYTETDLRRVGLAAVMLERGFSVRLIRRALDRLHRHVEQVVAEACTKTAEELLSAIRRSAIVSNGEPPLDGVPRDTIHAKPPEDV